MIPTAEEFLKRDESGVYNEIDITQAMIEFAKMHVEEALRIASEHASINLVVYAKHQGKIIKTEDLGQEVPTEIAQEYLTVNKDSILTYSLTNIK